MFDKPAKFININYHHNGQHRDSEEIPKSVVQNTLLCGKTGENKIHLCKPNDKHCGKTN